MPASNFMPAYDHIVVVVEENHSFGEIIGNPQAPYINSLANSGALLTNYHAITHPSQPNYLALYAGRTFTGYIETLSPRKHNPWESFPEGTTVERNFNTFPAAANFNSLPDVAFVVP